MLISGICMPQGPARGGAAQCSMLQQPYLVVIRQWKGHACRGADLVHAVPAGVFEHLPDAAELERWAQTRWEVRHLAGLYLYV